MTDPMLGSRVANKLANDVVALLAAERARMNIASDVSADLAMGFDQLIEDWLSRSSSAPEFCAGLRGVGTLSEYPGCSGRTDLTCLLLGSACA